MKSLSRILFAVLAMQTLHLSATQPEKAFDSEKVRHQVRVYFSDRNYKAALPLCKSLVEHGGNKSQALGYLAWAQLHLRNRAAALAALKRIDERNLDAVDMAWVHYTWSMELAQEGKFSEALARSEAAVRLNPGARMYLFRNAFLLACLDRPDEAETALASVGREQDSGVFVIKGLIAEKRGDLLEAKIALVTAANKDLRDISAAYNLARITSTAPTVTKKEARVALNMINIAIRESRTASVEFAPDCLLTMVLACVQATNGDYDKAAATQRKAIATYEARCAVSQTRFERALGCFKHHSRFVDTWKIPPAGRALTASH